MSTEAETTTEATDPNPSVTAPEPEVEGAEPAPPLPDAHADHERDHPVDSRYLMIAIILAAITAAEVATYYIDANTTTLVLILTPMMTVKFAMVAMFFMHLRFDSIMFTRVFVAGVVLAVVVYLVMLSTFHTFSG